MRAAFQKLVYVVLAAAMLAGCSRDRTPQLMNLRSEDRTPDEFALLPNRPIEIPEDLAALPAPTPGGTNRVDPDPEADVALALGGTTAGVSRPGIPASDSVLVSQATRFGTAANIREVLAEEDLEFRRRNNGRLLERWFGTNVYFKAYRRQSLDKYAELLRWRRAGVKTVGAPPESN